MARQKPSATPPAPDWTLTTEQESTVDLLASGKTIGEVAEALELSPQSIRAWCQEPGIRAAVNRRRQELWDSVGDRLHSLLPKAIEVLEKELEGEHALLAATHVLKACKLYGAEREIGSVEAVDIALDDQRVLSRRQSEQLIWGRVSNGYA
jgi:hypothetical protein